MSLSPVPPTPNELGGHLPPISSRDPDHDHDEDMDTDRDRDFESTATVPVHQARSTSTASSSPSHLPSGPAYNGGGGGHKPNGSITITLNGSSSGYPRPQDSTNGAPATETAEDVKFDEDIDELIEDDPAPARRGPPQHQQYQYQASQADPQSMRLSMPSASAAKPASSASSQGGAGFAPLPASASGSRTGARVGVSPPKTAGASKSRKSSCDLCHHRKIRCDQVRPSCTSCLRKGHPCRYSDDAEQNNPHAGGRPTPPRPGQVTVVSATNPNEKYTLDVPKPVPLRAGFYQTSSSAPSSASASPAWMSAPASASAGTPVGTGPVPGPTILRLKTGNGGRPGSSSSPILGSSGGDNRERVEKKKRIDRERIVNGYGSSSDEDDGSRGTGAGSRRGEGEGEGEDEHEHVGNGTAGGPGRKAVEKDLAELVGEKVDVDHELSELVTDDEAARESVSSAGRRREHVDDELSGELLELASAPPRKKKPRYSQPMPQSSQPQAGPYMPRQPRPSAPGIMTSSSHSLAPRPAARQSLPLTLPPTPAASSHSQARFDPYTAPLLALMASLPSIETYTILLDTFFADPFLTEGISLLRPQFLTDFAAMVDRSHTARLVDPDATTLAGIFACLAAAVRVLPEETGRLLLASNGSSLGFMPRSAGRVIAAHSAASFATVQGPAAAAISAAASAPDPTPLDQRYLDLALLAGQISEQYDKPSVVYVMYKLVLFRYATMGHRKDRAVQAAGWLAQSIKTAQALGLSKEWEGLPQGERELRRRVMWSLFVEDRHFSFETTFPYTIIDAHQGIHIPSPISEEELYKIAPNTPTLPPHATEAGPTACTALFIHTHLARRTTPVLDSFATVSPAGTPHDLVIRFDASLDAFQDALPAYLRLFPLTDTRFDTAHTYLAPHRVKLHSTLLGLRTGVHRPHVPTYLLPSASGQLRTVLAQVYLSSLRVQRSARMLDAKIINRVFSTATVFEATAALALVAYVDKSLGTASTSEVMALRAGIAEGIELLDSVASDDFARSAVGISRALVSKLDSKLTTPSPLAVNGPTSFAPSPPSSITSGPNGTATAHAAPEVDAGAITSASSAPGSQPAAASAAPPTPTSAAAGAANVNTDEAQPSKEVAGETAQPQQDGQQVSAQHSQPSQLPQAPASAVAQQPTAPMSAVAIAEAKIKNWVESWLAAGVALEVVLRDPHRSGWEVIIAGM